MSEDNIVTILDLLNLSLGTPEIGAVNFNLLHRFLLELVKHFSLARKQIDITDDISIQSALEETRMLYGSKSQTHFLGNSSVSDQADGKRLSESRESVLEGSDTAASGTQGKDGVIRENKGSPQGKEIETSSGGSRAESLQTKRDSTGELKIVGEAGSHKSTSSDQQQVKDTDSDIKQRSPDEAAQCKADSPQMQVSSMTKSRTHSPQSVVHGLAGRSFSSVAKESSKRTSPASSKTDVRKRSFIEIVPGLYQLERKISILEAKFESLSAAPTNLELVQQARDMQSRDSSTTAAGDMWQAMNVVRRIEVAEGAIDGITTMLDDITEQLKKMKENCPDDKINELSNKFKDMITNAGKFDELQAKLNEIDGKLKNIAYKTDLKPYITVKKINEVMDNKLQNYRQVSPAGPNSPKKTISSKLAQTEVIETSSQPAQTSPTVARAQTDGQAQSETTRIQSTTASQASATESDEVEKLPEDAAEEEGAATTTTTTPNGEQAPGMTAVTPESKRAYSEMESVEAASLRAGMQERDERRGSINTQAFEELRITMQNWADFREDVAQKIKCLEESLSNYVDNNSSIQQELTNLAHMQSTLKNKQEQVQAELNKLMEMQSRPLIDPIASQQDLSQLESSLDAQLQALSKSLQEMKHNFFQLYEMKESIGGLKESEDHTKSDIENIRREIMKIVKQLEEEQEARKSFAVGRKRSFAGDNEEFHQVRSSLLEMKNEIDKHNAKMLDVINDQNKKQLHLDALYSHVDQLENIKADRQQINREIEVKADRKELENKVSRDKFHSSLSCLDQSVQDLVEKLVGHEATLKQAINHITSDVNSKLDKMDMDTVKDYFEGKLKDLNSKVQRKPNEDKLQAAGSRSMLLQPASCISCDRPVHLYREGTKLPSLPFNKPLPSSKSNRPYMSFDLNDIRQKMHDIRKLRGNDQTESLGQAKVQSELIKLGAIKEDEEFTEVSNRPCGGNHTLTCPEKRTTIRVNKAYREDLHFIAQLSQKDLSIVDLLGYDGHVYKGHVNQLPAIPDIPKNTIGRRPTTGSGRPRTSSPI